MFVTSSPILYDVTCLPKIFFKLLEEVYVFEAIALEFKLTEVRLVQPEKASYPIFLTLLGMVTEVSLEQP